MTSLFLVQPCGNKHGWDVANSQVTNLTGLEHATSLTFLALQNNDISDLSPISTLANLTFVRLHGKPN